ncbi:MAG: hypothetical protein IH840_12255 [Candidatus Heimdallarchaeota archaeon]|nr:hypothetical protein [Candidatus Heimdallarchaeota archaeon]
MDWRKKLSRLDLDDIVSENDENTTFFLSKKGVFDEQFLAHVSKQQYQKATDEKIRRAKAISDLVISDNFPTFTINLTSEGPRIITKDFDDIPAVKFEDSKTERGTNIDVYLQNIGISSMVALAQGHEYNEGIFELPAPRMNDHRLMTFSIRMTNTMSKDPRLVKGFGLFQIIIFMPKSILEFLPSFSSLEKKFIPYIKSSLENSDLIEPQMPIIKNFILRTMIDIVLYYSTWDPDFLL